MFYVIVNPVSKSGRGIRIWRSLAPVLKERNIPYKKLYSKHPGHICQLIKNLMERQPADGEPINVILLGGDGTLNEALQGVTDFSGINFGCIPTGSSNDLGRDLGLPKDPLKILDIILENARNGQIRQMDLGKLRYDDAQTGETKTRYFGVSTGIGFDAAVCEEANASPIKKALNRFKLGKATYLGIALKQLIQAKSVSCELILDDGEPLKLPRFLFIAVMLHRYEGGGFQFAPAADATDGILNLCVVGRVPKPVILIALPTAFFGKHYLVPQVDPYEARKVEMRTSVPLWIHTDGEVPARSEHIVVTCEKQALRLLM